MTRHIALLIVFCAAFLIAPLASWATPITVPTDLNVGDKYRLAFVTSSPRDATSSDIADYNAFVTAVAGGVTELAALGTTWTAIGSTATVDARDNTGTNPFTDGAGVPIYKVVDTRIADTNNDLWDGTLAAALNADQNGNFRNGPVWTGSDDAGTSDGVDLGTSNPTVGHSNRSSLGWVEYSSSPSTDTHSLYAISAELTVVPEPGTLTLVCLGATTVAAWHLGRRRRRKAPRNSMGARS